MFEKNTSREKVSHDTYMMKGSKLLVASQESFLVVSQERDPRVIVDSLLGMLDILNVLAKRPTKYILSKKPGQEVPSRFSPVKIHLLKS